MVGEGEGSGGQKEVRSQHLKLTGSLHKEGGEECL